MIIRKALRQLRLGAKNPAQTSRILRSEAKMRLGLPTLRSIELAVTWICNLKCEFCYAEDLMYSQKRPPDIPIATVKKLIEDAKKLGLIHVNITGGEPMVRKDVFDLIDAIPRDIVVSVVTNSTLLNEKKIDAFKKVGVSTIQMSYGAYYMKSFKRDLARYARDHDVSVTLSVVNIESERQNVLDALKMAEEDGYSVLFNYPMRYKNSGLDSETYWKYRYHPNVREDNLFWSGKDRCPAGTQKLYVTNDGDVMTCDRIHGNFGNINEEPLKDIWMRMYDRFKDVKTFCLLGDLPRAVAREQQALRQDLRCEVHGHRRGSLQRVQEHAHREGHPPTVALPEHHRRPASAPLRRRQPSPDPEKLRQSQNSAFFGVRGNGMTSRMLDIPVA
jgi:MoaA/NifB/PqqE/SkfB family radical SAM enzyme